MVFHFVTLCVQGCLTVLCIQGCLTVYSGVFDFLCSGVFDCVVYSGVFDCVFRGV